MRTRTPDLPDDTALLFRRDGEGRACHRRAVLGELTGDDRPQIPPCFAPLLTYLERPISRATGRSVRESGYASMVDKGGAPRPIDMATVRRKLRGIAKQKAPGLTGNGNKDRLMGNAGKCPVPGPGRAPRLYPTTKQKS